MATWLKQSTAATVPMGPFVDSSDGVTVEDSLTISQADIRLSKNGGDFAQTNNSAGATHDENGYYAVPLDTTDTNTLGRLRVAINESGALPVWQDFLIVPANVYDSLVSGSDDLDVTVSSFDDDAITAASINTGALTADAFAADAIVAATLATGAITADAFAADAIVAATLATGAITADAFAADAIVAATLATGAISADAIAANAITADALAADCITSAKIADDAIGDDQWAVTAVAGCAVTSISGSSTAADNIEVVFDTDFATNYDTTEDMWQVDVVQVLGEAVTEAGTIDANVVSVSGDTTAADNLELAYDGTGYAGGTTKTQVNVVAISGSTTAADNQEAGALGLVPGTVAAGSWSTTAFQSDDVTEATADHYNGRVIVFTSGDLAGQACTIEDYSNSGGNGAFTVSTLTEAPSENDTFVIF